MIINKIMLIQNTLLACKKPFKIDIKLMAGLMVGVMMEIEQKIQNNYIICF